MQATILRRKFLEEEGKNEKLQIELADLKKTIQDLSNRLVHSENLLVIEKNQNSLLIDSICNVEKESTNAAKALENSLRVISGLRKVSPATSTPTNDVAKHAVVVVSQQISEAESAIKNLNEIMQNSSTALQEPYQELCEGEENEELEDAEVPEDKEGNNGVAEHTNGELENEYSSDEEVIHVPVANGKRILNTFVYAPIIVFDLVQRIITL